MQATISKMDNSSTPSRESDAQQNAQFLEILSFTLGSVDYGMDMRKVQEIRHYDGVTRIANAPAYVKGVMNLLGNIVPVLDMRRKLKLASPGYDQSTAVIILSVGERTVGMVVDSVSGVSTLSAQQIQQPPSSASLFESSHLIGIGSVKERLVILVDIDILMADADAFLTNANTHAN